MQESNNHKETLRLPLEPNTIELIVGDIHNAGRFKLDQIIRAVQENTYGKVNRVITLGDVDWHYERNRELRIIETQQALARLGVEMLHLFGNHDQTWLEYMEKENVSDQEEYQFEQRLRLEIDTRIKEHHKNQIISFIRSMHRAINIGPTIIRHALPAIRDNNGNIITEWPHDKEPDAFDNVHEYLRQQGMQNLIVGHSHNTYTLNHRGTKSELTLMEEGAQSDKIDLADRPLVTLGNFDQEGYFTTLHTDKYLRQTVQVHRERQRPPSC